MKPRFLRHNYACPDCGFVVQEGEIGIKAFDCPRCEAHYTHDNFIESNVQKWSNEHEPNPQ